MAAQSSSDESAVKPAAKGGRKYSSAFQNGVGHLPPRQATHSSQPSAEGFYFQKQMQNHTPLVIVLENGDELTGTLEWFDEACIKLRCGDGSRTMIYKHAIRYLRKHGDE